MILNTAGKVVSNYWLHEVFTPEARDAHLKGDVHIHDLDMLSGYCCGHSLRLLLEEGFNGVANKVEAKPPKHYSAALGQIVNFLGTLQNEWAGAQAFSSFDTYMAPFIKLDNLSYEQVKQGLQEMIFSLNVPSRWGSQAPFTNLTFDLICPDDLKEVYPYIGNVYQKFTYGSLQKEMDMINKAFAEIMIKGDEAGRAFTFPIPTYNITKDFNWEHPNTDLIFEMTAKYGIPYFQNFINSDLEPHMVRSMCPLRGDTLIPVKEANEDNEPIEINIREAYSISSLGSVLKVFTGFAWEEALFIKVPMTKMYKFTFENNKEVVMGENHLQPCINLDGDEETLKAKDITVGCKVPFISNEEYDYSPITSIEEVTPTNEDDALYCVSLDDGKHLFALSNGMITHNCRLQLDLTELLKRGNGLFGSAEQTGSTAVVTLNMARLGYLTKGNQDKLYKELDKLLDLSKDILMTRLKVIEENLEQGLYPYTKRYLGGFHNHFLTFGVNGMNEMIRNFSNDTDDITSDTGHKFASDILDHINLKMVQYQEETGKLFNLEATPSESACYRFARVDKEQFNDIIHAGSESNPYYTNSSQLPVDFTDDPFEALDLQQDLQSKYTGGTVLHLYMNTRIANAKLCKELVKRSLTNYRLPYVTITPSFSICPIHGYVEGQKEYCPKCDAELLKDANKELTNNTVDKE